MVVTMLLLACAPSDREPSERAPFTAGPEDTGDGVPPPPDDLDADGWSEKDGDCDDSNAAVFPGAYDRPNDGIDGDCADGDRTCNCLVLDAGATAVETYDGFHTASLRSLDLAYVLETGLSATSTIHAATDSFSDVITAIESSFASTTIGVATFDDYAYSSYGSAADGDKPFELRQQQTDDVDAVRDTFVGIPQHGGGDSAQSAMEGLYQALTGAGYDQNCGWTYDSSSDVKPFVAHATDPFFGAGGQLYDVTDESTGPVGMGFHPDAALRVIVYSTDAWIRDPENGYLSPYGCPSDAGFSDVVNAALDADVWLVGIGTSDLPIPQMADLADATDSLADLDGDGADEMIIYELEPTTDTFGAAILEALDAIRAETGLLDAYASVTLAVSYDPLAIVSGITPASYTDVAWEDVDALTFDVGYDTSAYGTKPVVGAVELTLMGDGFDLATVHVDVEIAPL